MTQLKVISARREDVFGDRVRVNEGFRLDATNETIKAGSVCRVSANGHSVLAVVRGLPSSEGAVVRLEEALRKKLAVQHGEQHDFQFRGANWLEEIQWTWNATDPGYRIAARLSVLSVALGSIGLVLGLISLFGCFKRE